MTVRGLGAPLSPALGGWLADASGDRSSLARLGAALGSPGLWLAFAPLLKPACLALRQDAAPGDLTAVCA